MKLITFPAPANPAPASRRFRSLRYPAGLDLTDPMEPLLRCVLVLSLIGSLAVCAWQATQPMKTVPAPAGVARVQSAKAGHLPLGCALTVWVP